MTPESYADLVRYLFPRLTGGIRWGLERTERILAAVGDPHRRFRSIHVGGTNGKGSVAASLDAVLRVAGHRTGLYTSPHLCSFRERIRIDGEPIGEAALLDAARRAWPEIDRQAPSFFEATTAMAFLAMAEAGVEVAVVEVGLGGRLDATNVIMPEASIVTNVALDHVQLLGDTLPAVAREKAGIFKPGVPAITAETDPEPLAVLAEVAAAVGAPLHVLRSADVRIEAGGVNGTSFTVETPEGPRRLRTPLPGAHQAVNAALAARAALLLPPGLRPPTSALASGLASVRWPGRLQVERIGSRTWIFDVAHNVAGVQALAAALQALPIARPLVLLVGVLGDKDWRHMLRPLFDLSDTAVLTCPPTAPAERAWDPVAVLEEVPDPDARAEPDFARALDAAAHLAGPAGTVVVTGSFHTVGDVLIALGRAPSGVDPGLPVPSWAA